MDVHNRDTHGLVQVFFLPGLNWYFSQFSKDGEPPLGAWPQSNELIPLGSLMLTTGNPFQVEVHKSFFFFEDHLRVGLNSTLHYIQVDFTRASLRFLWNTEDIETSQESLIETEHFL